ncbi:MAG: DUF4340 domain-containing protein [Gemmatimonadetes bacterium]|nr:DUF4340 domain-containing protein [Gemmatimonadota bacterium]
MSGRTLKMILGVLAILLILWSSSVLFSGRPGGGSGPDGGVASLLAGLDETTVNAVRIRRPDQTVSLQRSGDAWTVNGKAADSLAVRRFWSALAEAEVGRVVANNPRNHERMGLSADSAWAVEFTLADGGVASVLVGKAGPIFPSGYARLPDQDAVVVVSGDLRATLNNSLTDWRDKTILRVDTAAVARLVLETDEGTHLIARSDTTWSVDGGPANANTIRSLLDELANFVAIGFVDEGEVFQENARRVIALGAAQDTLGAVVITGEAGIRHARTPGNDVVFEVASFRADRITPDIEDLRPAGAGGA